MYIVIYVGMTMGAVTLIGEEERVVGLMGGGKANKVRALGLGVVM